MATELSEARELLESGDPQAAMRLLRSAADRLPPADVAPLVAALARGAGFEDLAQASTALAAGPADAGRLYTYGYACVERGIDAVAVPALREALRLVQAPPAAAARTGLFRRKPKAQAAEQPGLRKVLLELVSALEGCERHAEALAVLREHDALLGDWPERYLTVYNALMSGRLSLAREVYGAMSAPEGIWVGPGQRIGRMLERAAALPPADERDLRGWHYVLTGGLLTTLSPHGFDQGMTGRWAYLQDDFEHCRHGLERLLAVLAATGRKPASVALLADRGSRALGLAAARLLGVPAAPFRPGAPDGPGAADVLVVAYDLTECDPGEVAQLHERAPGQLLFEHATCWTDPPAVTADVCTLLGQIVNAPWESGLQFGEDGEAVEAEPDRRSAEELAEAILAAAPRAPEGDGQAPPDADGVLTAFAARAAGAVGWPAAGPRDRVNSSGPVRSSRFA
ncbi:hypothetical protein ACPC54_27055 [Kitasatospora sp. NPDC094028]